MASVERARASANSSVLPRCARKERARVLPGMPHACDAMSDSSSGTTLGASLVCVCLTNVVLPRGSRYGTMRSSIREISRSAHVFVHAEARGSMVGGGGRAGLPVVPHACDADSSLGTALG